MGEVQHTRRNCGGHRDHDHDAVTVRQQRQRGRFSRRHTASLTEPGTPGDQPGIQLRHACRCDDDAAALGQIGGLARRVQDAGFSGLLFTELARTAYLGAAVASQAAPGLELSTGVAVAFPRSPFVTAATAWELQEASGGRFRLGLGTQVRTHVVRRYGVPFERPGPRLRDYVLAVKACFSAFRTGSLDHHGEFYDLDFITPAVERRPDRRPGSQVDIAAVNPWMLRMAGEVADGVHIHPIGEPGYLRRHVLPASPPAPRRWDAHPTTSP